MLAEFTLSLMDSDLEENSPNDRQLTSRLYSNDLDVRVSQEILLGVGGVRILRKLGINPTVWHMNEGTLRVFGIGTGTRIRRAGNRI